MKLIATDTSHITADSGGFAIAAAVGGPSAAVSIGISVSTSEIDNDIKARINGSTVSATNGNIELTATSDATIDTLSMGGALGVAAGGGGGGLAGSGAGAGAYNDITNTTQAYADTSSVLTTTTSGAVKLSASDTSTITADAGGVAIAVAIGDGGAGSASVGAGQADNDIENTIQAYVDNAKVTSAGSVELTATA